MVFDGKRLHVGSFQVSDLMHFCFVDVVVVILMTAQEMFKTECLGETLKKMLNFHLVDSFCCR